jgi:hypothetical protein
MNMMGGSGKLTELQEWAAREGEALKELGDSLGKQGDQAITNGKRWRAELGRCRQGGSPDCCPGGVAAFNLGNKQSYLLESRSTLGRDRMNLVLI